MAWTPVHEAHAIDQVRVIVRFKSALPEKMLSKITKPISDAYEDFGFDSIKLAESDFPPIVLSIDNKPVEAKRNEIGKLFQRFEGENKIEEAGFRDQTFGFISFVYVRWENFQNRFRELFGDQLEVALGITDLATVRLEYWDRFYFDGPVEQADASELLANVDESIPAANIKGGLTWHSHSGWFEEIDNHKMLVNRNIDVQDETIDAENKRRVVRFYTLVDFRVDGSEANSDDVMRWLQFLHNRSLEIFSSSINIDMRNRIGIERA